MEVVVLEKSVGATAAAVDNDDEFIGGVNAVENSLQPHVHDRRLLMTIAARRRRRRLKGDAIMMLLLL